MRTLNIIENAEFNDNSMKKQMVNKGSSFYILNFNLKKGQELPLHHRDIDGELAIYIIEGEGVFLKEDGTFPAKKGEILIGNIREPHGLRAHTDMIAIAAVTPH